MKYLHTNARKSFIVLEMFIFAGFLLQWSRSDDIKCISVTEDNDYACLNGWRNEIKSRMDHDSVYFGVHQQVQGPDDERERTSEVIRSMQSYLIEEVSLYGVEVRSICINQNKLCSFWASKQECEKNRLYMIQTCPLACRMCLASYLLQKDSKSHV